MHRVEELSHWLDKRFWSWRRVRADSCIYGGTRACQNLPPPSLRFIARTVDPGLQLTLASNQQPCRGLILQASELVSGDMQANCKISGHRWSCESELQMRDEHPTLRASASTCILFIVCLLLLAWLERLLCVVVTDHVLLTCSLPEGSGMSTCRSGVNAGTREREARGD
jgi:hypothetical protein